MIKVLTISVFFLILLLSGAPALAQVHFAVPSNLAASNQNLAAGNLAGCTYADSSEWFGCFYQFLLFMVGLSAFGAIVYGGVQYIMAAGIPSQLSSAKQWITNGLFGLLLAAFSYVILHTINPDFTDKGFGLDMSKYDSLLPK